MFFVLALGTVAEDEGARTRVNLAAAWTQVPYLFGVCPAPPSSFARSNSYGSGTSLGADVFVVECLGCRRMWGVASYRVNLR